MHLLKIVYVRKFVLLLPFSCNSHPHEMPNSDREADGEGCWSHTAISPLIGHSKDADNKLEGEKHLHCGGHPQAHARLQLEAQKLIDAANVWPIGYWTLSLDIYHVHCHVASHVPRRYPVQHCSSRHGAQALRKDVKKGTEKRHLWTDKVGKGNRRVDVAAADVANGLDEGGGRQTKAQGHMKDVIRPGGPAQGGTHAEKYKEHGPEELSEDRPPKIHRPKLPHDVCLKFLVNRRVLVIQEKVIYLFSPSWNS